MTSMALDTGRGLFTNMVMNQPVKTSGFTSAR